jgi:hypothetical protein
MSKRAAERLAHYFRAFGYRVRIRQHKSRIGVSFYSVEWTRDTRRDPSRRRTR